MNDSTNQNDSPNHDTIDIEEYAQRGEAPPRVRQYVIRIDKQKYIVSASSMTGRELLTLASKAPPERFMIRQKLRGGQINTIGLDERVDFTTPGIERFMTLPLDQTDGEDVPPPRRALQMPAADGEYLDTVGRRWETVVDGSNQWLLVHDHPVPSGYNVARVTVAILIPPGYPDTALDMAYFMPPLARADGVGIGSTSTQPIDGQAFQRWSRHRTADNPWRAGVDDVSGHLALVDHWLARELTRR